MKYLKYSPEFLDYFGNPVAVLDPDPRKQREARQKALREGKELGLKPSEITLDLPRIEAPDFATAVKVFVNGIPYDTRRTRKEREEEPPPRATPQDMEHALHVLRAFDNVQVTGRGKDGGVVSGWVPIEEKALEWLQGLVGEVGGDVWGQVTAALVRERLRDVYDGAKPEELQELEEMEGAGQADSEKIRRLREA